MPMRVLITLLLLWNSVSFAQYNLEYFIDTALKNSPLLTDYAHQSAINSLQRDLESAQTSAARMYLTGNLLVAPYFNNNGTFITPIPGPDAVGYDPAVTNGGLYSAQVNLEQPLLTGAFLRAIDRQREVMGKSYVQRSAAATHDLAKQVTDQYLAALQFMLLHNLSVRLVESLNEQLKITADLVAQGNATASDYLQLRIETTAQSISADQTWQNYRSSIAQLFALCGVRDTATVMIDTVALQATSTESASRFLLQFRLDSMSAAAQQEVFEARYQPQVSLFFNAGLNAVELVDVQRRFGISGGLNISLPILDGGQRSITRQQTALAEETAGRYAGHLAVAIAARRSDAENRMASTRANLAGMDTQHRDYEALIGIAQRQLRQGTLSMVEYLTLLRNYIDLQKNDIALRIVYQQEISNRNYWNW